MCVDRAEQLRNYQFQGLCSTELIFIVAPCILKFMQFTHQQKHYLLTWLKVLIYIKIHNNIAPTCFGL